ncbi:MAG: hypothetical protein ONB48_16860 [candidate division KSB1 bacterium]|nr:hypothetical protein [candidate division KSB1 bacterium]MDZ7275150.1 hypothetical protein [candidate division KSB1 bacterium]MDZ7287319.1 hypothetical protein [candidate division KSB1 bacterium]MDZ7299433.1 hypothetical protein [candidate division KSB1 bacterium]MDZ7308742.1 hypothetical protein [candidate division KSB1 bacterium]
MKIFVAQAFSLPALRSLEFNLCKKAKIFPTDGKSPTDKTATVGFFRPLEIFLLVVAGPRWAKNDHARDVGETAGPPSVQRHASLASVAARCLNWVAAPAAPDIFPDTLQDFT